MSENEQLTSLATHLYVKLRRDTGRVIDVIWFMRNDEYAREILKIARGVRDAELDKLIERIEIILHGGGKASHGTPAPSPVPVADLSPAEVQAHATGRYRGGLR